MPTHQAQAALLPSYMKPRDEESRPVSPPAQRPKLLLKAKTVRPDEVPRGDNSRVENRGDRGEPRPEHDDYRRSYNDRDDRSRIEPEPYRPNRNHREPDPYRNNDQEMAEPRRREPEPYRNNDQEMAEPRRREPSVEPRYPDEPDRSRSEDPDRNRSEDPDKNRSEDPARNRSYDQDTQWEDDKMDVVESWADDRPVNYDEKIVFSDDESKVK